MRFSRGGFSRISFLFFSLKTLLCFNKSKKKENTSSLLLFRFLEILFLHIHSHIYQEPLLNLDSMYPSLANH